MKKLKTNKKNISWGLKDKDGNIITSKEEILERWANFYEDLYDDPNTCNPIHVRDSELSIPNITIEEICVSIQKSKSGKSSGIDNINAEFLKEGGDTMLKILEKLFNIIIKTGAIPSNSKKPLL